MERPVKAGERFVTFIWDGIDCADMGIYSITNGGTYTHYLEPIFRDELLDVPAYDGRYYYSSQYSCQQFQLSLFADNLSMKEYRNLREWLSPRKVGKLILSDQPYKYYLVKITNIGALGSYPLTDVQTPTHSVLGDFLDGNTVYVGSFTITFQTVGSVYGYGLSYYRDDLIYDALNHYGPGVYTENYYYDSGLLYKDMAPALNRTIPANAQSYPLTWYNPGTADANPEITISVKGTLANDAYIQFDNATTNATTVIDLSGLSGTMYIDPQAETITIDEIPYFGRFTGNPLVVGTKNEVLEIPESIVTNKEGYDLTEHTSIHIINDKKANTCIARINPLLGQVQDSWVGCYLCINGNGGAKILDIDTSYNAETQMYNNNLILDTENATTHDILPAVVEDGHLAEREGFVCTYIGEFKTEEEIKAQDKTVGNVAALKKENEDGTITYTMYMYRDEWAQTSLFASPKEFINVFGDQVKRHLIFGANLIKLEDLTITTNIPEFDMSVEFLPRYL